MVNSLFTLHHSIISTLLIILVSLNGCATTTKTFRVLDAETKKPIRGAVALAEWISVKGFGFTHTDTAKIVEAVTDRNGFFTLPAVFGTIADQTPHIKVYKPGYVGWDSRWIYLGCYEENRRSPREIRRKGFSMRDQDIYLEPWKDEYSFISHGKFIRPNVSFEDVGMKPQDSKYRKAIRYEVKFSGKERKALRERRK